MRLFWKSVLLGALLFSSLSSATTYKWRGDVTELYSNLDEACQVLYQQIAWDHVGCYSTRFDYCEKQLNGTDPPSSTSDVGTALAHFTIVVLENPDACGQDSQHVRGKEYHAETIPDTFYVSTLFSKQPQCNSCDANAIDDPISPSTGAVFDTFSDASLASSPMPFKRFYNSTDSGNADLSSSWRHSYDRSVVTKYSTIDAQAFVQSANTSALYADPATACASGFTQIKSNVRQWANAVAVYANGNCVLSKSGSIIGTVPVHSTGGNVFSATPVAYDVVRDDGQLIRFIVDGAGAIINPPSSNLKLQKIASGFTVTDANDNVEQYDASGKLLSLTSRAGVIQTMNYDGSGRLSGVSDSFGHQLTFGYDAQGHLSSVTKQ